MQTSKSILLIVSFLCFGKASAQTTDQSVDPEPAAVIELGVNPAWNLKGGGVSFGPTFAVEVTPVEDWLELEMGVTASFRRHSTEWSTDFLFKKPWTLSKKVEFMAGLGPEWIHSQESGVRSDSLGGEVVLDFMFWPSTKRRFGWYLEPSYECNFGRGHEQAIGISGGLLIAIRR